MGMIRMPLTGKNNSLIKQFRYITFSDEELYVGMDFCKDQIFGLLSRREFEGNGFKTWGQALVELEREQEIRRVKH
jgi:hypothetical protein